MQTSRRSFLQAAAILIAGGPSVRGASGGTRRSDWDDAVAMAEAVRTGKTTAIALVEQAIERLERVNPRINAVALPHYERARQRARAGVSGPLAGVPTLIKDNIQQKGLPFTLGSRMLRNFVADADARYVQAIERAGLISIGRSTLPEFAGNLTTESLLTGVTRNPWNLAYSSGGSSGGSSAAVAAGVVPLAHGNDFGGSIRHAAAPCGLVGLKPSRGRNVGSENSRGPTDFQAEGCVSRTVRDTAAWIVATETHGSEPLYPPVGVVTEQLQRKLRVGANARRIPDGGQPDPDVRRVFDESIALLERLGHRVQDQPPAFDGEGAASAVMDCVEYGFARNVARYEKQFGRALTTEDLELATLGVMEAGLKITDARLAHAVEILTSAATRYVAQFDAIDVYMTPVFSVKTIQIGALGPTQTWAEHKRVMDIGSYCWIDNVAGTPAISLPVGATHDGLPVGMQFVARPGGERVLLELAYQLEDVVRWPRKRPPVWAA